MKDNGLPIDYNVFQVTLQTQVVLVMTLQMCFVTRNWTLINFSGECWFEIAHFPPNWTALNYILVLFATTIAFFIFSGAFYSQGAYNITPGTFNLMGVIPHVWAEPIPWLNIFATLAIYLMILLAARFLKYVLFKDVQDEVIFCSKYGDIQIVDEILSPTPYRAIFHHLLFSSWWYNKKKRPN